MVNSCAAYNCSNRCKKGSGITFHKFPLRNPALLNKWLSAVSRDKFTPSIHHRLCSDHFTQSCFWKTIGKKLLKYDAVPTIFNFSARRTKAHFEDSQFESHRADGLRKLKPNAIPTIFSKEPPRRRTHPRKQRRASNDENVINTALTSDKEKQKPNIAGQLNSEPQKKETKVKKTKKTAINEISEECVDTSAPSSKVPVRERKRGRPPGRHTKDDGDSECIPQKKRGKAAISASKLVSPTRKSARNKAKTRQKEPDTEETSPAVDDHTELSSGSESNCFVCDKTVDNGVPLLTLTNTTKVYMHQKLDKIVTGEMELLIEEEGVLCSRCANLINYVDRIEVELNMITRTILNYIRKKFGMGIKTTPRGQEKLLPALKEYAQEPADELLNLDLEPGVENDSRKQRTGSDRDITVPESNNEKTIATVPESNSQEMNSLSEESEAKTKTEASEEIQCLVCKFKTRYKSLLLYHLHQHLKSTYWCDFCNITLPEETTDSVDGDLLELSALESNKENQQVSGTLGEAEKLEDSNKGNDLNKKAFPVAHTNDAGSVECAEIKKGANLLPLTKNLVIALHPLSAKDIARFTAKQGSSCTDELENNTECVPLSSDTADNNGESRDLGSVSSTGKQIRILNEMGMIVTQEIGTSEQTKTQETNEIPLCSELSCPTEDIRIVEYRTLASSSDQVLYGLNDCEGDNNSALNEEGMTGNEEEHRDFTIFKDEVTEITSSDPKEHLLALYSDASLETDDLSVNVTPGMLTYSLIERKSH